MAKYSVLLPIILFSIVIFITLMVYWPGIRGGFVFDDFPNIVTNEALKINGLSQESLTAAAFSTHSGPTGRPLSMVSFALNEYFTGTDPKPMKLTNLFIHLVNGFLVYWLTWLVLEAWRKYHQPNLHKSKLIYTAIGITSTWLLLPINLTSVLYIVQRMTTLAAGCTLLGLILYVKARDKMLGKQGGAFWWAGAALVCFSALGALCKESGVLLPAYAFVIEWCIFRFQASNVLSDRRLYWLFGITLILPGILGLLWLLPSHLMPNAFDNRPFTLVERLLTEPRVLLDYFRWTLVPSLRELSLYHDDYPISKGLLNPPTTLIYILTIFGLIWFALKQRFQYPWFTLAILWFFTGHSLEGSFVNLELMHEHRNYLPSLGILLGVFPPLLLIQHSHKITVAKATFTLGLVISYASITAIRAQQWSDPIKFATISAHLHPTSPRATYEVGQMYAILAQNGNHAFIQYAIQSLEHSSHTPRSSLLPEQGLLIISSKANLPSKREWWDGMEIKLKKRPATVQDIHAVSALVHCEISGICKFPLERMVSLMNTAIRNNPRNAELFAIYSNYALNVLHNHTLTDQLMHTALKLSPHEPRYLENLIKFEIYQGHFDKTQNLIEKLKKLNRFGRLDTMISRLQERLNKAKYANLTLTTTASNKF